MVINSHGKWPIIDDSPIQNLSGDFPKLGSITGGYKT